MRDKKPKVTESKAKRMVGFKLENEYYRLIVQRAEEEGRSVSNLMRRAAIRLINEWEK